MAQFSTNYAQYFVLYIKTIVLNQGITFEVKKIKQKKLVKIFFLYEFECIRGGAF